MNVSAGEYAQALYESVSHKPKEASSITARFIEKLSQDHNRHLLPLIQEAIHHIEDRENRRLVATVRVPLPLTKAQQQTITESLAKKYQDREIVLQEVVDPTLIGGIKLRIDDLVIDHTVKSKLEQLLAKLERR